MKDMFQSRTIILMGFVSALLFFLAISLKYIEMPNNQKLVNCDEYFYSAPALTLAETGDYANRKTFPAGLHELGDRYLGHTQLTPFFQALFIDLLGYSRLAIRLHSIFFFVLSAVVLCAIWSKTKKTVSTGGILILIFFSSPWIIFAGRTARPEMCGGFLVFLACLVIVLLKNRPSVAFLSSGFLAGIAAYNHPMFLGVSCLPFLFGLNQQNIPILNWRQILFSSLKYGLGAILAIASVMLILVLPYKEQWIEQFVQGISDPANIVYSARDESLIGQLLSLKARFSSFGFSYMGWYVAIALIPFLFKGGLYFYIGWIWLIFVMCFIHANTVMGLGYCVQFAMGIPILLLMNSGDRFPLMLKSKLRVVILVAVCVFFAIHHMKLVLSPNDAAMEFRSKEKLIEEQIASLPPNSKVIGPLEAAVPLLKNGHIYFEPSVFGFSSKKLVRYFDLINEQSEWIIDESYKLNKK